MKENRHMIRTLAVSTVAVSMLMGCGAAQQEVKINIDMDTTPVTVQASTSNASAVETAQPVINSKTATADTDLTAAYDPAEVEKPFSEEDRWVYLDRNTLSDDSYDSSTDPAGLSSHFKHKEIGTEHDGVIYYLEYVDRDNCIITFDNSANTFGRCVELMIYDNTFPNTAGTDWSLDRAHYYIEAGEVVTKQYPIGGRILEDDPVQFGISIYDKGFNYDNDKADIYTRSASYSLDITYYGIDNTISYSK